MVQVNLGFLLRKLMRRPTCILGPGAKISQTARILNARKSSSHIRVGSGSLIEGELFVFAHGGDIEIGRNCYVDRGARIWSAASIKIGDHVVIGPGVNVFDSLTHPIAVAQRHAQVRSIFSVGHPTDIDLAERPVSIGSGALIGAGAIILRGVEIGENVVVEPGAIVTKSILAIR